MHSAAPALPSRVAARAAGAGAPPAGRGDRAPPAPDSVRGVGHRGAHRVALFVLVAFHVLAVQHVFAIDRLGEERKTEELQYERLRAEVATLSAPESVVAAARSSAWCRRLPSTTSMLPPPLPIRRCRTVRRARSTTRTRRRRRALAPSRRPLPRPAARPPAGGRPPHARDLLVNARRVRASSTARSCAVDRARPPSPSGGSACARSSS